MEPEIESKLVEIIRQKRKREKTFSEIIGDFDSKLLKHDPIENSFAIEKYFGNGSGHVSATNKLTIDKKISADWLREYKTKKGKIKKDFKGVYVFIHGDMPIYVGISKGVIGRIFQHLKGHNHNTSTLAYNIGLIRYAILNGEDYSGGRKDFNFKSEVEPVKRFLLKQKIAFLPVENDEELYLFEVYIAMKLQCWLNRFETH